MNDALAQLRDIHLPEPVSWWPPAPGWWLLALLLVALVATIWWWRRLNRTLGLRRAALRELAVLSSQPVASPRDRAALLAALSRLLRRYVRHRFPGSIEPGAVGAAWTRFLSTGGRPGGFTDQDARLLSDAPYRPVVEADLGGLLVRAEQWIRSAR